MQQTFYFIAPATAEGVYPFVTAEPTTGGVTDGYALEYDLPEDASDELLEAGAEAVAAAIEAMEADPSIEGVGIEVTEGEGEVCEAPDCPVCAQEKADLIDDVAALFAELFEALEELPMNRELAVAITRLEEAEMWAGKAVEEDA